MQQSSQQPQRRRTEVVLFLLLPSLLLPCSVMHCTRNEGTNFFCADFFPLTCLPNVHVSSCSAHREAKEGAGRKKYECRTLADFIFLIPFLPLPLSPLSCASTFHAIVADLIYQCFPIERGERNVTDCPFRPLLSTYTSAIFTTMKRGGREPLSVFFFIPFSFLFSLHTVSTSLPDHLTIVKVLFFPLLSRPCAPER